jgi:hypothetical protein
MTPIHCKSSQRQPFLLMKSTGRKFMNKILMVLLAASLLLFLVPISNADGNHADMRGTITKIRRASAEAEHRMVGTITVEAENKSAKVDKANLIITDKTRILKEQDGQHVQVTFEEVKIGQLVEAQFVEGPTIMIYPLQVEAAEILILNTGKGSGNFALRAIQRRVQAPPSSAPGRCAAP